jgi:penicillin-binding protein 2
MYYLQVVEAAKYRLQSDSNRISTQLLAPPRGLIFDRNGIALAVNQHNYRVLLIP